MVKIRRAMAFLDMTVTIPFPSAASEDFFRRGNLID
jgi:hypothetical protein